MDSVKYAFKKRNPRHLRALEYLEDWKNTFWKTTDSHVTEMITKTEEATAAAVGVSSKVLDASIKGGTKYSTEEIAKIRQKGQSIVNDLQMKEVTGLLDMLNDFIELHQSRYYIVLDELDEKWVGNSIRYQLIKSLIETTKDLNRLSNIKPIVILRHDLLGRVFRLTKDTGFQEEKYTPLYVDIKWSRSQLTDLINFRIDHLLQARYSKRQKLTYKDILPESIAGIPTIDYLLDRTIMRPRDIIEFVNRCIKEVSLDDGIIDEDAVIEAEHAYSQSRLDALSYEWFTDYPGLKFWTGILRKRPAEFAVSDILKSDLSAKAKEYILQPPETEYESRDILLERLHHLGDSSSDEQLRKEIVILLYTVNLIGITLPGRKKASWYDLQGHNLTVEDIDNDCKLIVHPCYRSALRIQAV